MVDGAARRVGRPPPRGARRASRRCARSARATRALRGPSRIPPAPRRAQRRRRGSRARARGGRGGGRAPRSRLRRRVVAPSLPATASRSRTRAQVTARAPPFRGRRSRDQRRPAPSLARTRRGPRARRVASPDDREDRERRHRRRSSRRGVRPRVGRPDDRGRRARRCSRASRPPSSISPLLETLEAGRPRERARARPPIVAVEPATLAGGARARAARDEAASSSRVLPPSTDDVARLADDYVTLARGLAPGEALVRSAEPSVRVAIPLPGSGGRCTHLAALIARDLLPGVTFLAAASDGVDGSSGTGGAIVDAFVPSRRSRRARRRHRGVRHGPAPPRNSASTRADRVESRGRTRPPALARAPMTQLGASAFFTGPRE